MRKKQNLNIVNRKVKLIIALKLNNRYFDQKRRFEKGVLTLKKLLKNVRLNGIESSNIE